MDQNSGPYYVIKSERGTWATREEAQAHVKEAWEEVVEVVEEPEDVHQGAFECPACNWVGEYTFACPMCGRAHPNPVTVEERQP